MLLVKLIEPPLAEPHERWCERSGDWLNLPPTRLHSDQKEREKTKKNMQKLNFPVSRLYKMEEK